MTHLRWDDIASEFAAILKRVGGDLSPDDRRHVSESIGAGEFGVAFDTLCTQLYERDVRLPDEMLCRLETLGQRLKLDPSVWKILGD
jgi:hypothetical protein